MSEGLEQWKQGCPKAKASMNFWRRWESRVEWRAHWESVRDLRTGGVELVDNVTNRPRLNGSSRGVCTENQLREKGGVASLSWPDASSQSR